MTNFKTLSIPILILFAFLLNACGVSNKYEFWDISKFNVDENALRDSTEFKIIYCSRGPDVPEVFDDKVGTITSTGDNHIDPFRVTDYYVHYVVLDIESNDTVNILTPEAIQITENDRSATFFYTKNVNEFKTFMFNTEYLKNLKPGDEIQKDKFFVPKHDRVARDPDYDHVADNNHKTIIGFVNRMK